MTQIILNSAKCLLCGDVLISRFQHDFVSCRCASLSLDGGLNYLKRVTRTLDAPYVDLSINSNVPFEVARGAIVRGSYGKDNRSPLHYIKLCDMTDNHLKATIIYCKLHNQTETIWYDYYLQEVDYRKQHNITIGE